MLAEGLAYALHGATVELTPHNHRVDHTADIVHRRIGDDRYLAGQGVDLDFADVAGIGPAGPADRGGGLHEDALLRLTTGQ